MTAPTAALIGVRAVAGTALLLAPRRVLGVLPEHRTDRVALNVARVLGGRDLVEAGVLWRRPTRRGILIGAGVDVIHAATMVALAVARPKEKALPLTSALGAVTFSGAGIAAAVQADVR